MFPYQEHHVPRVMLEGCTSSGHLMEVSSLIKLAHTSMRHAVTGVQSSYQGSYLDGNGLTSKQLSCNVY